GIIPADDVILHGAVGARMDHGSRSLDARPLFCFHAFRVGPLRAWHPFANSVNVHRWPIEQSLTASRKNMSYGAQRGIWLTPLGIWQIPRCARNDTEEVSARGQFTSTVCLPQSVSRAIARAFSREW